MRPVVENHEGKAPLTADELLHLSRLITIGELSACFAHEVANPLMMIRGHLRLIEETLPAEHPLRINLEAIDRASRRIEDMSKRMLNFSRKRALKREDCDAAALVSEALRFMQPYFHGRYIEAQLNAEPDLPPVKADRWQMVQALVNLFQNAADAMSESERRVVAVRLHRENNHLQISVSDTGHGIAATDLPRVFSPFFTTKGERGTGLGLYISRRLVEEHQGTLTAQSNGRGATFVLSLPL